MRNAQGTIIITSATAVLECDTFTCSHCQQIVSVPPKAAPTDCGGWCVKCAKCVCNRCAGKGCTPWEKRMERMERRDRLFRSMGLCLFLFATLISPLSAQAPSFGPDDAVLFDYYSADITAYQVARYEVQWDGGAWSSLGMPTAYTTPQTLSGAVTYKVPPPFSSGNHTASFRACNAQGCGGGSVPFAFARSSAPVSPLNIRKGAR